VSISGLLAIAGARTPIPKMTANIAIAAIVYVVFINTLIVCSSDILDAVCCEQFFEKKLIKEEEK